MITHIAFIRGINVGGNSVLPMKELALLCTQLGFANVRTYINSGNVLFSSTLKEKDIQEKLETALLQKMKKSIGVAIRTPKEIQKILTSNPFSKFDGAKVGVLLLSHTVSKNIVAECKGITDEEIVVGKREVYVCYPNGMGRSKLVLPVSLKSGTVRNINTLTKLLEISGLA